MEAKLIDVMGDDLRVVNAARVSFDKESEWEIDYENSYRESGVIVDPWIVLSEKDQKLIQYLTKHNHWTPFSHVVITMREKVPIFVARQRFKHMVGFTYNEVSRRYVDDKPEFFQPTEWRKKAENKKQGSSDEVITKLKSPITVTVNEFGDIMTYETVQGLYEWHLMNCSFVYEIMLENEVAPEQARMVLPQSMYTEYYSTGSLAAWARMINLRKDSHAQKEIQDLAQICDENIRSIDGLKYSWEALIGEKWY